MFIVVLKKSAGKELEKLPQKDRGRVREAIRWLREEPWRGKKLGDNLSGFYAIRVWPYRIIYSIERKIVTVTVVAIGHRKDVYEKLRR